MNFHHCDQSRRSTGALGGVKTSDAGFEHIRQRAGIIVRIGRNLGKGNVAGIVDEFPKLPIGDWSAVDPESVERNAMCRCFFRIMLVRSHAECAARNPSHIRAVPIAPTAQLTQQRRRRPRGTSRYTNSLTLSRRVLTIAMRCYFLCNFKFQRGAQVI